MITNQNELQNRFWQEHPDLPNARIPNYANTGTMYPTDTRVAWHDWKDQMCQAGEISQELRDEATLD